MADRYNTFTPDEYSLKLTSEYTYDYAGRVTSAEHLQDLGTSAIDYAYAYNNFGRMTSATRTDDAQGEVTRSFTYDSGHQLISEHATDGDAYTYDDSHVYDANGNRVEEDGDQVSQIGANNQLQQDAQYEYDDEGNRIKRTDLNTGDYTDYSWDHRNRLTKVEVFNDEEEIQLRVEYAYDAFNRLIGRKETRFEDESPVSTLANGFVYDGNQIVAVLDGAGDVVSINLWGQQVDQLLGMIISDEPGAAQGLAAGFYWTFTDHQGSVRDWVDTSGAIVRSVDYSAFGVILGEPPAGAALLFGWTGRLFDLATGNQYNGNRWYDPPAGRWLSEDPIGFDGGLFNLGNYVGNDPVNRTDPSGLQMPLGPYVPANGKDNFQLQWDRALEQQQLRAQLISRVKSFEAKHSQYAYFKEFNLSPYYKDIYLYLSVDGIPITKRTDDISIQENADIGVAARYGEWLNIIKLSKTINKTPEHELMHELTHMLDDMHDWYISNFISTAWNIRKIEGLGYAAQHIFNNLYMLETFENDLRSGRFQTGEEVDAAWQGAWDQLGSYLHTDVWAGLSNTGPITDADIQDFEARTGVNVSHDAVYQNYQQLVEDHFDCYVLKPAKTKPALK